ncbi:MAG: heparinase II/III-family protein, partial [Deltaproteobacteria bacterium]|nr:heparinase II/III-family protein [Deltaproteobacteria bacterium]
QPPAIKDELSKMARWLVRTRRPDGTWPGLNDSAPHMIPVAQDAIRRAIRMNLLEQSFGSEPETRIELPDTGWTILREGGSELLFETGPIGPRDNPGHGHADALSYELFWGGTPVVTDSGVSTYEDDETRWFERSGAAHACVTVDGQGSDEVWKSFRVGKRGKAQLLDEIAVDKRVRLLRGKLKAATFTQERALLMWPGRAVVVFDRLSGMRKQKRAKEILDHVPLDPGWNAAEAGGVVFLLGPGGRSLQLHVVRGRVVDLIRGSETGPRQGWLAQGFGKLAPRTTVRIAPDEYDVVTYAFLAPSLSARATDSQLIVRAPGAELQIALAGGMPTGPKLAADTK